MQPRYDEAAQAVLEVIRSRIGSQDTLWFKTTVLALLELSSLSSRLPLLLRDENIWPTAMREQFRKEISTDPVGFRNGAVAGMFFRNFVDQLTTLAESEGAARIGERHTAAVFVRAAGDGLAALGVQTDVLLARLAQDPSQDNHRPDDPYKKMLDDIVLESEQEDLLSYLVEAARNLPREKRQEFIVAQSFSGDTIIHPGLPGNQNLAWYVGDVLTLAAAGLVRIDAYSAHGEPNFDVTPLGFEYYDHMKRRSGQPIQQIQAEVRSYMNAQVFQQRYPKAYQRWADAEQALWGSESQRQLTTIGHLCREAMQEFATELVEHYQPPEVDPDKTHTVARVRSILDERSGRLGRTEKPFLKALLDYWGTLSDLVQRQEHGGQKEGKPLVWEDARRVVFQTAVVMFELDRSLVKVAPPLLDLICHLRPQEDNTDHMCHTITAQFAAS